MPGKKQNTSYIRIGAHAKHVCRIVSYVLQTASAVAAVACLTALTIYVGFEHNATHAQWLYNGMHTVQTIFTVNVIFSLFTNLVLCKTTRHWLMWTINALIILLLFVWIIPSSSLPPLSGLTRFVYGRVFLYSVLATYSVITLCTVLMRMPGRRTNPALLMAFAFIFFIFAGAFILMMPRCTYQGITFTDSLFVSTSAVCITGLTPVDIAATFTPLGQIILALLFQIGGLGIITFTSFFALFFTGTQSIYSQLLVRDMIYSKSINALIPTLFYILSFTIAVEAVGAVAIYFALPPAICGDTASHIGLAVFHSMSAFCNVGFSTIDKGLSNPALMHGNQMFYVIMGVLVFAGALGFPILVNFREIVRQYMRRLINRLLNRRRTYKVHIFDLNTKIVLATTLCIFAAGSIAFFTLERNNTLKGMSLWQQTVQSAFNAIIPRSGGYATVNPANLLNATLLIVMAQMVIGGSSQSMGGGIKVNTLGVIIFNLRAVVSRNRGIKAFKRTIAPASVRRANAVVTLALFTTFAFALALVLLQPQMPLKSLIFETISATFSVGSSLGITSQLCPASKCILCIAMFTGRVGLLSLLTGLVPLKADTSLSLPPDNVIIN